MDAFIIFIITVILMIICWPPKDSEVPIEKEIAQDVVELNPGLNPTMYEDPNAFMLIANELGFH